MRSDIVSFRIFIWFFRESQSFHDIITHRHRVAVELDAYLHHLAAFGFVGERIVLAVDLVECFLCRAVHLQLENIGDIRHLQHNVDAALGALHLRAGIEIQHVKDEPKGVFIEPLIVRHALQFLLEALNVWDAREE